MAHVTDAVVIRRSCGKKDSMTAPWSFIYQGTGGEGTQTNCHPWHPTNKFFTCNNFGLELGDNLERRLTVGSIKYAKGRKEAASPRQTRRAARRKHVRLVHTLSARPARVIVPSICHGGRIMIGNRLNGATACTAVQTTYICPETQLHYSPCARGTVTAYVGVNIQRSD